MDFARIRLDENSKVRGVGDFEVFWEILVFLEGAFSEPLRQRISKNMFPIYLPNTTR